MKRFYNNDFLVFDSKIGINKIKCISLPNIKENQSLSDYVCNFINFKTFPYINTEYGSIIENTFHELSIAEKIEVIGHLESLLNEIEEKKQEAFIKLSNIEIENIFSIDITSDESPENKTFLYSSIKGGQYGEMLVNSILISLGFNKIISKLHIQWGTLSPTGIDVPYINFETKEIVLGEVKLYKNIKNALVSISKDLNDIINGNKFDKDIEEWKKRVNSMPDIVKDWYIQNYQKFKLDDKRYYFKEFKIIILGIVFGESIEYFKINEYINDLFDDEKDINYEVVIITIPIVSKDELIEECEKAIKNLLNYAGDNIEE